MPKSQSDVDDILNELAGEFADDDDDDGESLNDRFNKSVVNRNPREIRMADDNLRPHTLDEIIGQEAIKRTLRTYMNSAKRRNQPLDHVLLSGPPGLGKTTIASVIATEMDNALILDTGPTLTRDKMMSHVTSIINTASEENLMIVLFVDEIHDTPKETQTILLPLLEEFKFIDVYCPKFTLVGATTDPAKLPAPLRDRLQIKYQLDYYSDDDLLKILRRSFRLLWELDGEEEDQYVEGLFADVPSEDPADLLAAELDADGNPILPMVESPTMQALRMLAHRAKGVPRQANQLLMRARDFGIGLLGDEQEIWETPLTPEIVTEAMKAQGVDRHGLSTMDRKIMTTLFTRYKHRAGVSVKSIAAAVGESAATIEVVYEPNLVRLGFLERGERGRALTTEGQMVAALELENLTEY